MLTRLSNVVVAASSYNLTDLATVKSELGIPDAVTQYDAFITRGIEQTSAMIAETCRRVFPVERLTDRFFTRGAGPNYMMRGVQSPIELSRYPLIKVISVTEDGTNLIEGTDFEVNTGTAQLFRLSDAGNGFVPWSTRVISVTYDGGYGVISTESASVPADPGPYTVTAANTTTFFYDYGVTKAGVALTKVTSNPAQNEYSVSSTGIYTFAAADAGADVVLSYVYKKLPAGLTYLTLRWMTMRYKGKDRDPLLMSRSQPDIGEERFWVGSAPGGTLPPEIEQLIGPFRDTRVF